MRFSHLLALFSLLALTACGPKAGQARFVGRLAGVNQADVLAFSEEGAFAGIDTIHIQNGEFTYERPLDAPVVLTLLYPNFTQTYVVLEPGKEIKMKGAAAKIGEASITGTENNQLLTDFRTAQADRLPADRRLAAAQFVRDHASTLAAIAVFKQYFVLPADAPAATTLSLLNALREAQPASLLVRALDESLRARLQCRVGSTLSKFTATSLEGNTLSSSALRGKPALICLFATWSTDINATLRALRDAQKTYGDKLLTLSVSLDYDVEQVRRFAKADTLAADRIVCDTKAFASPTAQLLAPRYVSSFILCDAEGRIVARDLTADALKPQLQKLFSH